MKRLFILIAAITVCFGCKTEDTPGNLYDGPDYVYFSATSATYSKTWNGNWDAAVTHKFTIKTVGNIYEDRDREVLIEVTSDIEGLPIDELISVSSTVIPKGETEVEVTVTLFNNKDYFVGHKGSSNLIKLTLKEGGDDFKVWPITESGTFDELEYIISVSNYYS